MRSLFITLVFLVISSAVSASPLATEDVICMGQVKEGEFYIGKDHNVKAEVVTCPNVSIHARKTFEARQANLCGTSCTVNCFLPAGGGPDPNECHIIADALRYESQNTGALFEIDTGTNNTVVMTYSSCKSFIVNQDLQPVLYCRTDWADTLDNLAFNCQATQNAHGGNCVATDQSYFIQVQSS